MYNKEYYQSNNYKNYSERENKYKKLGIELNDILHKIGLIEDKSIIIDYGCGFGFLSTAFLDLGYKNTYSYDISKYAEKIAKNKGCNWIEDNNFNSDILIVLDVFEHMTDDEINEFFKKSDSDVMIARIPVADFSENDFYLEVSKADKTHINCKDKNGWKEFFIKQGYKNFLSLNLLTIYDTTGVFCFIALK